ncbi:MAG: FliI/YscN family ATPase [Phycisphaerales bacterium]
MSAASPTSVLHEVSSLAGVFGSVARAEPVCLAGRVVALRGLSVIVEDLPMPVGTLVQIQTSLGGVIPAELVGFTGRQAVVMMLAQSSGVRPGDSVVGVRSSPVAMVGPGMLGRCINGMGEPIDGLGPIAGLSPMPLSPEPVPAMRRQPIHDRLATGVRAIDTMLTLGRGQRLGVFAGPGVGKSTLLGAISRHSEADVNVIALIGERGREVKDFIAHSLGPQGLAKSIVVVATGDESPVLRVRAARLACAAAEHFRDRGQSVLLMMDSITRYAHAQRQIGLSIGEPPATKGYTPSVYAGLALLLERAGAILNTDGSPSGSITGLYTILVEGDDMTEPIADAARGILDGHVMLSRKLAQQAHYPAIDVLDSVSRVADDVCDRDHIHARHSLRRLLSAYADVAELVQIGAYAKGSNPEADVAIESRSRVLDLLRQSRDTSGKPVSFDESRSELIKIAALATDLKQRLMKTKAA